MVSEEIVDSGALIGATVSVVFGRMLPNRFRAI